LQITKDAFDSIPVGLSRLRREVGDSLYGKGNVGAGPEGSIHEESNSFVVGDVAHLRDFGCGQRRLSGGEADVGVKGDRDGLEVLHSIASQNRVDVRLLEEGNDAAVAVASNFNAKKPMQFT